MANRAGHRSWGHVRQQPTKSKLWQASYIGPDGLRHFAPTTFTHKSDAESWLGKERRLIEREALGEAEWIPPKERAQIAKVVAETLADYGQRVIDQRTLKPRTRIHYNTLFANHISPGLGRFPINRLTSQAVRAWYAKTLNDKPTYRAHAYGLLKSICETAVKDGLLDRNPCQIDGASHAKAVRDIAILEIDELAAVANAIRPERFKALVLISAWCGLRFGEVTELRRKDIEAGCEVINVGRAVTHRPSSDSAKRCFVSTPKAGKGRKSVAPPHIRADIKHHLDTFVAPGPESLLFPPARGGCHLIDKVFRDSFSPALATVGRDNVRIHDLRHFAGSMATRVGSITEAMERLGHATPDMTLRYSHMVSGRDVEMANQISALAGWVAHTVPVDTSAERPSE